MAPRTGLGDLGHARNHRGADTTEGPEIWLGQGMSGMQWVFHCSARAATEDGRITRRRERSAK
eukprot:6210405-Lingulodinium_polyedra.AAC.1